MRRYFEVLVLLVGLAGCLPYGPTDPVPAADDPGEVGYGGFPAFAEPSWIPDHLFDRRETVGPPMAVPGTFLEKRIVRAEQYTYPAELVAVADGCGIYMTRQWVHAEEQTWDVSPREPVIVERRPLYAFWMERFFRVCPGRATVMLPFYDDLQAIDEETEAASLQAGMEEIRRDGLRPRPTGSTPPPGRDAELWRPPGELPADFAHGFAELPDEGTAHVTVERIWVLRAVQIHECVVYASYQGYYRIHRRDAAGNELDGSPSLQAATDGSGPIWRYEQWPIDDCGGEQGALLVDPPADESPSAGCSASADCYACCELLADDGCFAACEPL